MDEEEAEFAQTLRNSGLRVTRQRLTIMALLEGSSDHPNAEDLLARAKEEDDSVSQATVYRTLSTLEAAGIVRKLTIEDEPARFEIMPNAEHEHLVDIESGEVVEIENDQINRLREEQVERLGYEIVSQTTVIRARKLR